ncbi:TPA: hypothetical protein DCG61_02395 [Patescibacteria group bacterium]|jgi:hypothetical protein|nr:hypothetical protein [Patescibacteria group bacterium]
MEEKLEKIIHLIEQSALDRTIKDILIRDLQSEGLTDFLREQIRVYCLEGIKQLDAQMVEAKATLENKPTDQNPT